MAKEDPKERVWDFVASSVRERFGRLITEKSPALRAIIDAGSRYVKLETDLILFDQRALTLGLLLVGAPSASGMRSYAAFRFREWVEGRIPPPAVAEHLVAEATPAAFVETALSRGNPVDLSISVKNLVKRAGAISMATIDHSNFDGRHLFAAMIEKGSIADQVQQLFGLSVGEEEVEALLRSFIDEIVRSPEESGTRESWEAAIGLATTPSPPAPPEPSSGVPDPPSGPEIMRFSHDGARRGDDVLETGRDVEALAKLICLKGSTPLAAAIFGGWGSGKTTFMEALDDKVEAIAGEEARWVGDGATSPFVTRVVQIRFNAWQFVDANLWASLTAEFFDQLRAGGWRRAGTARHAALVERVNSHVHSLTAEAAARRNAVIEINQQVLEAKEERDIAAKAVRDAAGKALSQGALDRLGELYEAQKGNIRALGLARAGQDPAKGVDAVLEAVRSSRSIVMQARAVFRIVGKYRLVWALAGVLLLLAAIGGWLLWSGRFEGVLTATVTGIGAAGALARAILPALSLVASVGRRGAGLARDLEAADQAAVKELLGKEARLRDVAARAETAAGSAERSDRDLARYLDPSGPSNPPRLLRYVLEDDPETKAFEKEIGLIGRARRLFQAVDDIIREEDGSGTAPQRIVLYIDDLDRCTEEQVYNVLQAIHLLLAFRSFAVIVGVDVKWIESALAAEFTAEKLPALSEIDRRQHAVHYLEKIFQVAFWLDPLSAGGEDGGSFARFVKALTQPEAPETAVPQPVPPPVPPSPSPTAPATDPGTPAPLTTPGVVAVSGTAIGEAAATAEARRSRAAFRTVDLERAEIEFLASPEIAALAGSTPRSVKRLVNVYRLVRSRLADSGASLLGSDGRPPDYPLVALSTAIETGQPVEVAVAFLKALANSSQEESVILDATPIPSKPGSISFRATLAKHLAVEGEFNPKTPSSEIVQKKTPALPPAFARIHELRGGDVSVGDVLRITKLARRFSFNRYH